MYIASTAKRRRAWFMRLFASIAFVACMICAAIADTWYPLFWLTGSALVVLGLRSHDRLRDYERADRYSKMHPEMFSRYLAERQQFIDVAKDLPYVMRSWFMDIYCASIDKNQMVFVYRGVGVFPFRGSYACKLVFLKDIGVDKDGSTTTNWREQVLIFPALDTAVASYCVSNYVSHRDCAGSVWQRHLEAAGHVRKFLSEDKDAQKVAVDANPPSAEVYPDPMDIRRLRVAVEYVTS